MKPRFSILTLLCITAYVAGAVAAFAMPATAWTMLHYYSLIGILLLCCIEAASFRPPRAIFATATLLGCLTYLAAISLQPRPGTRFGWFWPRHLRLPHEYFATAFEALRGLNYAEVEAINHWAAGNVALATGCLCGALALWRYRALERRSKKMETS